MVASIYASVAIANEGYHQFVDLCLGFLLNLATEKLNLARFLILGMEGINFFLLFIATVFTVPAQGDPLSIILNCTAILAISKLDDGMFIAMHMRACTCSKIDKEKSNVTKDNRFRFYLKGLYFFGVVWVFGYLVGNLYAKVTSPTNAPTLMPTSAL